MAANLLCPELLDKIFRILPSDDLCAVSQVCQAWNRVAKLTLRRQIFLKQDEEEADAFWLQIRDFEPRVPIQLVLTETQSTRHPVSGATSCGQNLIRKLLYPWIRSFRSLPLLPLMAFNPEWCSNITELYFEDGVTFESVNTAGPSIFSLFTSVQKVEFRHLEKWNSETCKVIGGNMSLKLAPERLETQSYDSVSELDPPELKWQGKLYYFDEIDRGKEQLLTAAAMHNEWSSKVTTLEFDGVVAMQEWNVAGSSISDKFLNLKELVVKLEWIPDYVSEIKVVEDVLTSRVKRVFVRDGLSGIPKGPERKNRMKHRQNKSFLMLMNMSAEACNKITHLTLQNELAVEDWNVVGSHVLSKFTRLKELNLMLISIHGYVSTLELPKVPAEAATCSIEELYIELRDVPSSCVPRKPRPQLDSEFVALCPKLQHLSVEYTYGKPKDGFACVCGNTHRIDYEWSSTGQHTFEIYRQGWKCDSLVRGRTLADYFSASAAAALAPLANTLPVTSLHMKGDNFLCHLRLLQQLDIDQKLTTLSIEVWLLLTPEVYAQHFQCLVDVLKRRGCESLVDLELVETPDCNYCLPDLHDFEFDSSTHLQLPTVKRLRLDRFDGDKPKTERSLFYDSLVKALPNVEELTAKFDRFARMKRFAETNVLLEYSAELAKLRSLTLEWMYKSDDWSWSVGTTWFSVIQNNLAKHQALENLTFSWGAWDREPVLKFWEAAVRGCAAAPNMRLLTIKNPYVSTKEIEGGLRELRRIAPSLQVEIQYGNARRSC